MGAEPVVVLYASINILNLMQAATGSQCREIKVVNSCLLLMHVLSLSSVKSIIYRLFLS